MGRFRIVDDFYFHASDEFEDVGGGGFYSFGLDLGLLVEIYGELDAVFGIDSQ